MTEEMPGCARPTSKVSRGEEEKKEEIVEKEEQRMAVQIGKKAPDFEAPTYQKGKFGRFKLSEHEGHWVMLCFYPGDFTFV